MRIFLFDIVCIYICISFGASARAIPVQYAACMISGDTQSKNLSVCHIYSFGDPRENDCRRNEAQTYGCTQIIGGPNGDHINCVEARYRACRAWYQDIVSGVCPMVKGTTPTQFDPLCDSVINAYNKVQKLRGNSKDRINRAVKAL